MTFLITGATGEVGSRVVTRLLWLGDRPRVFVRDAKKARTRFDDRVDTFIGILTDSVLAMLWHWPKDRRPDPIARNEIEVRTAQNSQKTTSGSPWKRTSDNFRFADFEPPTLGKAPGKG